MKSILVTTLAVLAAGFPTDSSEGKTSVAAHSSSTTRMVLKCHSRSKQLLGGTGVSSNGVSQAKTASKEAVFRAQAHPVPRAKVEADLKTLSEAPIVIIGNKFQFQQTQQVCIAVRLVLEPRVQVETGAVDIHSYLEPCQPAEAYSVVTKISETYYQGPILHTGVSVSTPGAIDVVFDNVTPRRAVLGGSSGMEVQAVTYESHYTSRFVMECTSIRQYAARQQHEYDQYDSRCNKMLRISVEYSSTSQYLVNTVTQFVDCANPQLCHGTQACNQDKCIFWSQKEAAPPVAIDSVRTVPTDMVGAVNNATQAIDGKAIVVQQVPGKETPKVMPPASASSSTMVPLQKTQTLATSQKTETPATSQKTETPATSQKTETPATSSQTSSMKPSFRLVPSAHSRPSYKHDNSSAAATSMLKTQSVIQTTSLASIPTQTPLNSTTLPQAPSTVVNATTSLPSLTNVSSTSGAVVTTKPRPLTTSMASTTSAPATTTSTSRASTTSAAVVTTKPRSLTTSMASTTSAPATTTSTSDVESSSSTAPASTCAPKSDEELYKGLDAWKNEYPSLKSQVQFLLGEIGLTRINPDALNLATDDDVKDFFYRVHILLDALLAKDTKAIRNVRQEFEFLGLKIETVRDACTSVAGFFRLYRHTSTEARLPQQLASDARNVLEKIQTSSAESSIEVTQIEVTQTNETIFADFQILLDITYALFAVNNQAAHGMKSTRDEAVATLDKIKSIFLCPGRFQLFMDQIGTVIWQFQVRGLEDAPFNPHSLLGKMISTILGSVDAALLDVNGQRHRFPSLQDLERGLENFLYCFNETD